jgi:glycine oxidase
MNRMGIFDAVVVGGGIIGASIALEVIDPGMRVVILDRQEPGRESSWAAAGMLSPAPDSPDSPASVPLVPLAGASLAMYPAYVAKIEEISGTTIGYRRDGTLEAFFGPDSETDRDEMVSEHRRLGLTAEALSAREARRLEPELSEEIGAAAWLADEATVSPRELMQALLTACRERGIEIRGDSEVRQICREGNRATGVETSRESFAAGCVIVAAGCFSHLLPGMARWAPTRPVRGQMAGLRFAEDHLQRVLRSGHNYVVPREGGLVAAGSTLEDAGFEKKITAEGISKILAAAVELAPRLAHAEVVETWCGLRPDTPDHLPVIGPAEVDGLFFATGHHRNGILLAPVTARIIGEWILRGASSFDASAFSPLRFANNIFVDEKAEVRKAVHDEIPGQSNCSGEQR